MYNLEQMNSCVETQTWSRQRVLCCLIILLPKLCHSVLSCTTASTMEGHQTSISIYILESSPNGPHLFNFPYFPVSWGKHKGWEQKYFPSRLQWKVQEVNDIHVGGRKLFSESMLDARYNARLFHVTSFDLHSNLMDGYHYAHFNNKKTRLGALYFSRDYTIHLHWQL